VASQQAYRQAVEAAVEKMDIDKALVLLYLKDRLTSRLGPKSRKTLKRTAGGSPGPC